MGNNSDQIVVSRALFCALAASFDAQLSACRPRMNKRQIRDWEAIQGEAHGVLSDPEFDSKKYWSEVREKWSHG